MKARQKTIRHPVECHGVGVNLGRKVRLRLVPAEPGTGLVFVRTDLGSTAAIPVRPDAVAAEPRRTVLRAGKAEVQMTEHLLAAVAGLAIDNLTIEISGPELPVGDGSALIFAELILEAGVVEQKAERPDHRIREPISLTDGDASIEAQPAEEGLRLAYTLDYPESPIPRQTVEWLITPDTFMDQLAPARTFVFEHEAARLIAAGFGRAANPDNTLVVRADGSLLGNTLRFEDELARHKLVDLLGDLRLAGGGIVGHIRAERSGHAHNLRLAEHVHAQIQPTS
ncbi:MAG: UDP-3-O-[3-hydroxymyristoyl] N-acetylglucosamine deacetylase [Candidatus Brocadiae bacterium]|nr:UDP-3-O-[3-hydroxymyristoyl] N-acetylglucosamine deacetylase [Candidatus Brocadiia bacterium]